MGSVCVSSCRCWMFVLAMLMSLCVDIMVLSSAYIVSFTSACGVGCVRCVYVEECG